MEIIHKKEQVEKKHIKLNKEEREAITRHLWTNNLWFFDAFTQKLAETLEKKEKYKIDKEDSNIFYIPYSDGIGEYKFKISKLEKLIAGGW